MAEDEFGAYWLGSERVIPDKGDLSDYWVEISSGRDFLRGTKRYAEGRKSGARLSGGYFIGRLAHHFSLVSDDGLRGFVVTGVIQLVVYGELVKLNICREIGDEWAWRLGRLEEEMEGLRQDVRSLRGLWESRYDSDQDRFSTWMISCMTQLMEATGRTYQDLAEEIVELVKYQSLESYVDCSHDRIQYAFTTNPLLSTRGS
ncbi:hypothetical protein Tco_0859289 [Tanacetum coccineum]|uniref:Uncharacterized protein n=1 Tax=Tanacetum coccineum TaxID=301880 RepID=A0ABQ5BEJ3_9ASTR